MQNIEVPVQVAQLMSQVLHILLSDTSPYSLIYAQEESQVLVMLFPQRGIEQLETQTEVNKYSGELQLRHVVAVV
jgi:hypothetical protein